LFSPFSVIALGGPGSSYVAGMGTMTYDPAHVCCMPKALPGTTMVGRYWILALASTKISLHEKSICTD
jgi:hypothetical protein